MNNVVKRIEIDLYSPASYEVIKAQQGDNNSRVIEFALYDQGKPYIISNNVSIKMEGHRGDNSSFSPKDCTVADNIITVTLDSDVLYEPGTAEAKIVMYNNDSILSTIPFKIHVQKNPCDKNKLESEKSSVIDWLVLNFNKLKTSFEEHLKDFSNPHKVTKSQVGLGNVPNVSTNDQTPTYTETTSIAKLVSGEKLSVAFSKISKAISDLMAHLNDNTRHITVSERANWDDAHNKSHQHSNETILDKITQSLLDNWNAAYTHISDTVKHITSSERTLWNTVSNKVDKIEGKGLSTNDYTTADKNIVASMSSGAVTGIKGNTEGTYRTGNVNITPANIGLGNVDNTADKDKSVKKATQDGDGNVITNSYAVRKVVSGDFNDFIKPGIYAVVTSQAAHRPEPDIDSYGLIVAHHYSNHMYTQIAFGRESYNAYIRTGQDGGGSAVWTAWKQIYVEGNISQNAGIKKDIVDLIYPVGSIYMSVNSTSPATLFGGTWVRWGNGRVPVGVDTSQTEFNTVGKTGGSKTHSLTAEEMPSHTHSVSSQTVATTSNGEHTHTLKYNNTANAQGTAARINGSGTILATGVVGNSGAHTHNVTIPASTTGSTGTDNAHNNLQPYITCYMWKRTA